MLHEMMIALHTASALLCFAFGSLALLPKESRKTRQRLFRYYLVTLMGMSVFLAGAILAHVSQLDEAQRIIFPGLFLLSVYMLIRGVQARAELFGGRDMWFMSLGFLSYLRQSRLVQAKPDRFEHGFAYCSGEQAGMHFVVLQADGSATPIAHTWRNLHQLPIGLDA